jgi:hypothetical protein
LKRKPITNSPFYAISGKKYAVGAYGGGKPGAAPENQYVAFVILIEK